MDEVTWHEVDVCVVGGGTAGLAAAVAAARGGATVVLMQDRPVLGGNASSEGKLHICGADRHMRGLNLRETGLLEELRLANLRHNPQRSHYVFDLLMYDLCRTQENLRLLLNCSACEAEMDGRRIVSVTGWQSSSQSRQGVRAKLFIDCSGEAVLGPLTGAAFRVGREGRDEFGESVAPAKPDRGTMGLTVAFSASEQPTPQAFQPPAWAYRFDRCEDLPSGLGGHRWLRHGYWWVEAGGLVDTIADTEAVRDELMAVVLGVWDHIKNRGDHGAAHWALDWIQFTPGKRESRRYIGRHILTANDIAAGGPFPDTIAYGGWTMDEHPPVGWRCGRLGLPPAVFNQTPQPYGIPYGVLVARDIENLMFAGRCASCSHMAMASTRVMATGMVMGQAAGTAAALAAREGLLPPDLAAPPHIDRLQQALLRDDCYLPGIRQRFAAATTGATYRASFGDPAPLRDGWNRPIGDDEHAWHCRVGDSLEIDLPAGAAGAAPTTWGHAPGQPGLGRSAANAARQVTILADSALHLEIQMSHWHPSQQIPGMPPTLLKDFRLEVRSAGGPWRLAHAVRDNTQRLIRLPLDGPVEALRLTIDATWGDAATRLFAVYVD